MKIQSETRTLTSGPAHHFFGYYSICPWNAAQTYLVCLESSFQDHLPEPGEMAGIGVVDAQTGQFERVAETGAWNLQQGAMLHWNPLAPDTELIHNDRVDGDIVSRILNIHSGNSRVLPRPVSAVSHNGHYALSLTYGRLQRMRKVVGYGGASDPNAHDPHPANDGIFLMDLRTGDCKLAVSIQQVYDLLVDANPILREQHMWFNHVAFNRSDNRFFFLARCWEDDHLQTGMYTANLDGSELREVVPFGKSVSHFDWRNDTEILVTYDLRGRGREHVLHVDGSPEYRVIGDGLLNFDGHPSFSPDSQWFVTDKNVLDSLEKWLLLCRVADEQLEVLEKFPMYERRFLGGDLRCDLHPRWNRDGTAICVDAQAPDRTRQLHIVNVSFDD
ncbi:MAG: hypothetical protein CL610_20315 [Anaerolineaceae bacterium]|nr:hypothetical protein [Anaerolineaceae bacterium]